MDASVSSSDKNVSGQKSQYEKTAESIKKNINEYETRIEKLKKAEACIKNRKKTVITEAWCLAMFQIMMLRNFNMIIK